MFKCTFLERENIVESRTDLHLSLRGLDVQIMAIKDWWSTYFKARNLPRAKIDLAMDFWLIIDQSEAERGQGCNHQSLIAIISLSRPRRDKWRPVLDSTIFSLSRNVHLNIIWPTLKNKPQFLERENIVESRTGLHLSLRGLDSEIMAIKNWSGELGQAGVKSLQFIIYHLSN